MSTDTLGGNLGTDQVLLYDVEPWNKYGFGGPNFGENVSTINRPIWQLTHEIGQLQLYVMTHVDAMRKQAPSRNTVERIGKMLNRANTVLGGRMRLPSDILVEPGHSSPAPLVWMIHPCPYFPSDVLRNKWLAEYNDLLMMFLTNCYQHSDNNLSLTITQAFSSYVYRYIREIKINFGTELLGLQREEVADDTFVFTTAHYQAYNPSAVTINIEDLDRPGPLSSLPTEDSLKGMLDGIPANMILPNLKKFPHVDLDPPLAGSAGAELSSDQVAPGTGQTTIGGNSGVAIGPSIL